MLVLSRRESEKVVFPSLGISVEVSRILGKTVRIGIDAPEEIRVIRGELEDTADLNVKPKTQSQTSCVSYRNNNQKNQQSVEKTSHTDPVEIQRCLDAANLAIHLAQNQLQQELTDRADEALDQALLCLKELETAVHGSSLPCEASVRESLSKYRIEPKKSTALILQNSNQDCERELQPIVESLRSLGYNIASVASAEDLVRFLKHNVQPSLVLTNQTNGLNHDNDVASLRMFGIGSLQKSKRTFELSHSKFTCWVSNRCDEEAISNQLLPLCS